jgi:Tol biopolymer transport system component
MVLIAVGAGARPQSAGTIVFVHAPNGGPPWPVEDIYTMDAGGRNVKALTHDGHSSNPAWSPDGKRILFVHDAALQNKPEYCVLIWRLAAAPDNAFTRVGTRHAGVRGATGRGG